MTRSGTVLKKQTTARSQKPIIFLRAIAPSDLFMFSQIYRDRAVSVRGDLIPTRLGTAHNVFGVWSKRNVSALGVLAPEQLGDDVCIGDGGHAGEAVVFCLAGVNLGAVLFYGSFGALQLCTVTMT